MTQTLLYVNNTDPVDGGGGDRRILEEAKELTKRDFEARILASRTDPNASRERSTDGVRIRTVKCVPAVLMRFPTVYFYLARSLFPLVSFPYLLWVLWHEDVDVAVDSYTPHPSLLALLAPALRIPVVAIVHEYHDRTALRKYPLPVGLIQLAVQNLLRLGLYTAVVVPREQTKRQLRSYGVDVRIEVVPNGIQYDSFREPPDSVDVESYDLLVVSRLVRRKGVDLLLDAMQEVVEERPETTLAIAGSGPERTVLEAMSEKYDLTDNVEFLGFVSEERKIGLLHACDVFVLPSRQEGFGIAVLEAMATGTPVVANDLDILRELLPAADSAFVDATDGRQFGETIVERLHQWAGEEHPGRVNQDQAESYSWERVGQMASEVYDGFDK